jgi:hypothetical protein
VIDILLEAAVLRLSLEQEAAVEKTKAPIASISSGLDLKKQKTRLIAIALTFQVVYYTLLDKSRCLIFFYFLLYWSLESNLILRFK